jgi:hypothetical protein
MKTLCHSKKSWFLAPVLSLLIAGCATSQPNWDNRVGKLTYDQAVQELGTPRSDQTLNDGNRVVEWCILRGSPGSYGHGPGQVLPTPGRPEPRVTSDTPARLSQFLRLTFSSEGKLTTWQEYSKYE